MTFAEFIAETGPRKVANRLGRPINTVYSWSHLNRVPRLVWPEIILGFPEIGLRELMEMEAASKSTQRA